MVVERWASSAVPEPPRAELLASVQVGKQPTGGELKLERITFERSSSRTLAKHGGTVVIVESGAIDVHLNVNGAESAPGTPPVPRDGDQLTAGDVRLIPAGIPFRLTTGRLQAASVLQLRVEELPPGDRAVATPAVQNLAPGVTRELLAHVAPILAGGGPFTLSMHRVTLGPQT
jgi:hypothetical protein